MTQPTVLGFFCAEIASGKSLSAANVIGATATAHQAAHGRRKSFNYELLHAVTKPQSAVLTIIGNDSESIERATFERKNPQG